MQNDIQAIRADLERWSAGKPRAVRSAVANLDGWLRIVAGGNYLSDDGELDIDVFACTARAVETLRKAIG